MVKAYEHMLIYYYCYYYYYYIIIIITTTIIIIVIIIKTNCSKFMQTRIILVIIHILKDIFLRFREVRK